MKAEADLPPAVYKGDLSVDPHQGWHSWPRLGTQGGPSMLTVTLHRRQAAHPQQPQHRQAHLFLSPPTPTHDLRELPGNLLGNQESGEATPQRSVPGHQAHPQLCPLAQQSWSPRGHSPPHPTRLPSLCCHLGTPGLRAQGCNLRVVWGGTSSGSLWFDSRVQGTPALCPP